jgi:hypothetical protein
VLAQEYCAVCAVLFQVVCAPAKDYIIHCYPSSYSVSI